MKIGQQFLIFYLKMKPKVINNLEIGTNHYERISALLKKSDSVIIASPYLMSTFRHFFENLNLLHLKRFHLITTLLPLSSDQINKVYSLFSLVNTTPFNDINFDLKISLNNRLHGKVYIFKKNNKYISAIITSANFTNNGLISNHEWGMEIFKAKDIHELEKGLLQSISVENISREEIGKMKQAADEFLELNPNSTEDNINLDLTNLILPLNVSPQFDENINYWLKPIGVTGDIIPEGHSFEDVEVGLGDLNFSKQRPKSVKPGDILIAYGVGTTKIFSVYRVTSHAIMVTEQEKAQVEWYKRWPWYVNGQNLTPKYGASWWLYHLHIGDLRDEYLFENEDKAITAAGGSTLGALNFGKDKLKLHPEFGIFLINKVLEINNTE